MVVPAHKIEDKFSLVQVNKNVNLFLLRCARSFALDIEFTTPLNTANVIKFFHVHAVDQ